MVKYGTGTCAGQIQCLAVNLPSNFLLKFYFILFEKNRPQIENKRALGITFLDLLI